MRHLSRSEFDHFSTCLLNLYTLRDDDVRVFQTLATLDHLIHGNYGSKITKGEGTSVTANEAYHSDSRSLALLKSGALHPQLLRALKNVRNVLQCFQESTALETALEAIGLAAIRLGTKGQILDPDTRATKLLSHYCPLGEEPALPVGWFAAHRSGRSSANNACGLLRLMVLESTRGELTVSLLRGAEDSWLLLQECRNEDLQKRLREAGLTAREAEVLLWVVKGKTNNEVAVILGTQPATIKKHLKGIYVKFGIESRMAALSRARALVGERY
jgi:DNA-binding CsgD family transcriptional regulator